MAPVINVGKASTPSDAYRNPVLDNISIAAFQAPEDFVANITFPTVPVDDESFKFYVFDMDSIAQDKMRERAPGTEAEEGGWNLTSVPGLCTQFGYKEKVPEELILSAGDAANIDTAVANSITEVGLINGDRRFAKSFFSPGKWGRDVTGNAAAGPTQYVFWNNAASTPIDDIQAEALTMKLAGKRAPNTLVLGALLKKVLVNHPQIIGRLNNGQTPGGLAQATLADLAKAFEVDRVIVGKGVLNTAKEGAPASNAFILDSKSALLCYVAPLPSRMTPSAGYRFAWRKIAGNNMGIRTWRYWDQPRRSWFVEQAVNDAYQQTAQKLGTFFSAIIQ
jgi:hypothetical protein